MAGLFIGLAARRLPWMRLSILVGSAALGLVAVPWSLALSESNAGGSDCSFNPQHGYVLSLVLSAALATAGVIAAVGAPNVRYARAVALGTSATALIVLVGTLAYVTAANPSCQGSRSRLGGPVGRATRPSRRPSRSLTLAPARPGDRTNPAARVAPRRPGMDSHDRLHARAVRRRISASSIGASSATSSRQPRGGLFAGTTPNQIRKTPSSTAGPAS